MSTSAAFVPLPDHHRPTVPALSALPPAERGWEHLVVLAPLCLVPLTVTAADVLVLSLVLALLIGADTALVVLERVALPARQWAAAAMLGAALWLTTAAVLGTGAMVTFGLFLVVRCLDRQVPALLWPARLGLAALATALVVDLSLVTLAIERSIVWLALGSAIGIAFASARLLAPGDADLGAVTGHDAGGADRQRVLLEAVLVTALVFVLAFYGALLGHEPALLGAAVTGGYLTVPLLALAVLRLALLALSPERQQGVDPLAATLLVGWAVAAASLFGHS